MIAVYALAFVLTVSICQWVATAVPAGRTLVGTLAAREPQIDGLRGVCALLVALHHGVFFLHLRDTGVWDIAPSDHLLKTFGKAGVAFFFLICALLFWGRIARQARFLDFNWRWFAENRIRRLVPMYVVAVVAAVVILAVVDQGFALHVPARTFMAQLLACFSFDFLRTPQINDSFLAFAAISVSWSLKYEWVFYVALPLLALSHIRRFWYLGLPALIAINEIRLHLNWLEYFAYGSIVFELSRHAAVQRLSRTAWASLTSLALFLGTSWTATDIGLAQGWPALTISLAFLPIAAGNDWLGFLSSRGIRAIGAVSYSVYLLNILVSSQAIKLLPAGVDVHGVGGVMFLLATALALLWLSYGTYRSIEVPFQKRAPRPKSVEAGVA